MSSVAAGSAKWQDCGPTVWCRVVLYVATDVSGESLPLLGIQFRYFGRDRKKTGSPFLPLLRQTLTSSPSTLFRTFLHPSFTRRHSNRNAHTTTPTAHTNAHTTTSTAHTTTPMHTPLNQLHTPLHQCTHHDTNCTHHYTDKYCMLMADGGIWAGTSHSFRCLWEWPLGTHTRTHTQ